MIKTETATTSQATKAQPTFGASKRWHELSQRQKTTIMAQGVLQLALTCWALWDMHHRDPEKLRGSKWLWTGLAFVQPVGPIAYLLFGRRR